MSCSTARESTRTKLDPASAHKHNAKEDGMRNNETKYCRRRRRKRRRRKRPTKMAGRRRERRRKRRCRCEKDDADAAAGVVPHRSWYVRGTGISLMATVICSSLSWHLYTDPNAPVAI